MAHPPLLRRKIFKISMDFFLENLVQTPLPPVGPNLEESLDPLLTTLTRITTGVGKIDAMVRFEM